MGHEAEPLHWGSQVQPGNQGKFGTIHIATGVLEELRVGENLPGSEAIREAIASQWLIVAPIENTPFVQLLRQNLDRGFAETIALALVMQADWTLLDELEGRRIARSLGLNITGILGILLRSWRMGELSSVREVMNQLRERAGFHIAPALFMQILTETGEIDDL
jgi:predicted nucleic acid-binding protein